MMQPKTINMRWRRNALPWALALVVWLFAAAGAFAAEVIYSFDSDATLAKNGELSVTEVIAVQAEGREIRHGIYRDFPLTFKDAGGALREVDFKLLSVTRDGRPEPYFTKRIRGFLRIYAGDKDKFVSRGGHTYVFHYRTGRQVRWFDGKPELNWNVTGNFWHFPIEAATYRLHLADGAAPLRWTAYTGRLGARGDAFRGSINGSGVLTVETTQRLGPGEGLTVVAALPETAVAPLSANDLLWYRLFDNRRWVFAGLGFVLVFGYYAAAWTAVGRDPKGGTIIPLFHPPQGVSPALANYIRDWGFGREKWRAFTAAALSLAVRGLIRFDESGDTLTLTATGKQPEGGFAALPPGEGAIFSWVSIGGRATINKANGEQVAKVGKSFTTSIEQENRNRFFRRNLGYVIAGLAMTAAVVVGIANFGGLQEEDISIMVFMGFGGFMAGIFLVPVLQTMFSGAGFVAIFRSAMSLVVVGIFIAVGSNFLHAMFPDGVGSALPVMVSFVSGNPFPFALVAAFAALNGLFFYLMSAPTALGRPIMDKLAGFRLYLETAESDRLNMAAPEITTERFEALLPYAVALDVEKPWARAFEKALRRAHPGDAEPMRHYHPGWTSSGGWSGRDFGSAVGASVAGVSGALASAVPVSSGSSGFGGGGGSGGGGGGGGGGGW
jgi:Predicted membrane protein (DUF2207) C-terminal domain/Predicted membrane protein (DUF2207) N-terminal domain